MGESPAPPQPRRGTSSSLDSEAPGTDLDPALAGLEPAALWRCFDQIRRIPRPSLKEEGVRQHLEQLAAHRGWKSARDDAGNLVLYVPGNGAGKDAAPLAIQGHMDMVCTKREGVAHDFDRDPISLVRDTIDIDGVPREVLRADDTTLGSDNGIGLAAGLAVALDDELDRPPLELVFTADEEVGMTGAEGLDPELVSAKRLLNLDAEEDGSIYLSCAGGRDIFATWMIEREDFAHDDLPVHIHIGGLAGGHSGVEIHLGRVNAIMLLVQALCSPQVELDGVRLGRIDGGGQDNAIPRSASALLWCAKHRAGALVESLEAFMQSAHESMGPRDARNFRFEAKVGEASEREAQRAYAPLSAIMSQTILKALRNVPDGVLAMSEVLDELVESSTNVGILETHPDEIRLVSLTRSSKKGAIESLQGRMELAMEAAGAEVHFDNAWPGWEANLDNPLVKQTVATFKSVFERPPQIKAIHGGLECGYLSERLPGTHMVAFGPEIRHAHTPDEAIVLDTVPPFFALVRQLVADLCSGD